MNELAEVLKELASELGTTTEYLWKVLISQARIHFIVKAIQYALGGTAIIAFLVGVRILLRKAKEHKGYDTDMYYASAIAFGLICLTIVAFMINGIGNLIIPLLNPEYWALDHILRMIGK